MAAGLSADRVPALRSCTGCTQHRSDGLMEQLRTQVRQRRIFVASGALEVHKPARPKKVLANRYDSSCHGRP